MDLLSVCVGIFIGWVSGRMYMSYQLYKYGKSIVHMLEAEIDEDESDQKDILLYTMSSDKYTYLYVKNTGEFIAQGASLETALETAYNYAKIPNTVLVEHNDNLVHVREGKIVNQ